MKVIEVARVAAAWQQDRIQTTLHALDVQMRWQAERGSE